MADAEKKTIPQVVVRTFGRSVALEKAESHINAVQSKALNPDDEFAQFFKDNALHQKVDIIQPPYNMSTLAGLCQLNNALSPALEAMVTNIDGTGHTIKPREGLEAEPAKPKPPAPIVDPVTGETTVVPVEEPEKTPEQLAQEKDRKGIEEFFEEVFPAQSFPTVRKQLRRDLETVGNAYIEVMRNVVGKLVFLRYVRAKDVRLVKLDDPVNKPVALTRNGERIEVNIMAAERRYAQIVGSKIVFFKEMNATRELHKTKGLWEDSKLLIREDGTISPENRANELIHLTLIPDVRSPYGVPRWIPQLPSVLGSRKAEEHNLEFFDSGGIPPVLVTVAGGQAGAEAQKTIEAFFSGQAATKQRGAIVEIESTGGTIDKEGTATKVEVHRFGAEQVKDSMFENYDERAEKRVRRSFRLPPLFVGQADDFSFATAFASYTVAEAQVFDPERSEFDEMVNNLIMPELDPDNTFEFRSKAISVNDTAQRLDAIKIALEAGAIGPEGTLEALNELVGLDLKFDPDAFTVDVSGLVITDAQEQNAKRLRTANAVTNEGKQAGVVGPPMQADAGPTPPTNVDKVDNVIDYPSKKKKRKAEELVELATRANTIMHKAQGGSADADAMIALSTEIAGLDDEELPIFNSILSVMQFSSVENDPGGLARLAGCSLAVLAAQQNEQ